ncbi:hypothetical protein IW261DRAFT_1488531 [Armillaria novae-zelandiae]|uniref:Uncharacterized protein n=1 Tax=Armillaria novae-zelandiae TaxID=153914 RepID=A0AA39P3U5_9AGAR|nr:hypothetical protein IW261DRAFT_1488531 [Armillaria novae-zelandiae]
MWKTEISMVDEITGCPTTALLTARHWECRGSAAAFRSYLDVRIPVHRTAFKLTRALTATHHLTVERGKCHGISREGRLCRMCSNNVEDVPHVLFLCPSSPADLVRRQFLSPIWGRYPSWKLRVRSLIHLFLAGMDDVVDSAAHFAHEIFKIWDSMPLLFNHHPTAEAVREYS